MNTTPRLFGTAALCLAMSSAGAMAQQAVVCVNCSTIGQQILDYARQFEQLTSEVSTELNTLNSYKNAVQNTVSLPQILYRDITGHVGQITDLAKLGSMTGGYTNTMLSNLSAGSYPIAGAANYATLIARQSEAVGRALTQSGKVLDKQNDQLDTSSATLADMQDQAAGSDSRNGILQALTGTTTATGQLVVTQQAAVGSTMQGMLTAETARAERESYIVTLTDAHQKAGIKAACDQVSSITVPACQ
jgi:P-type conjugative transfer protein TrbJ